MTTFDVVTTYAERHWDQYAKRFVDTFVDHWKEIRLRTYTDEALEHASDWLTEFKKEHSWRPTSNYRFDAVRFAHKVAAIEQAYRSGTADVLIWIDADCVTHADVDSAWLEDLLGDSDFAYLGRDKKYSEAGFLMFRRCPAASELIQKLVWLYRSGALFELPEWHDSWAIDHVRKSMESVGILSCVSISGIGSTTGHPFVNGPLGEKMDHCKGGRKSLGKSRKSDLKTQRSEAYWNAPDH